MRLNIFSEENSLYQIKTPVYQGPLDLLLQLIEKAELDITKLALAEVTEQYLNHLKIIEEKAPEEVSSFLVIAAKLLQIKSEALLPRPPAREPGEEDPGDALIRQLREYKRFKKIADFLGKREKQNLRTYSRPVQSGIVINKIDFGYFDKFALMNLARNLLKNSGPQENVNTVIKAPIITIRDKIKYIVHTIKRLGKTSFYTLIREHQSRIEVVVTFLAMLELIKQRYLIANQETLFGDIAISPSESFTDKSDFDLEFND